MARWPTVDDGAVASRGSVWDPRRASDRLEVGALLPRTEPAAECLSVAACNNPQESAIVGAQSDTGRGASARTSPEVATRHDHPKGMHRAAPHQQPRSRRGSPSDKPPPYSASAPTQSAVGSPPVNSTPNASAPEPEHRSDSSFATSSPTPGPSQQPRPDDERRPGFQPGRRSHLRVVSRFYPSTLVFWGAPSRRAPLTAPDIYLSGRIGSARVGAAWSGLATGRSERSDDVAWFRIDDQLHSHPKARAAGLAALGMWSVAGAHSMAYKTDGFVPDWFVRSWPSSQKLAERLVSAGLWRAAERGGEHGWVFHDWLDYQSSSSEIEADREKARRRQAALRAKRRASQGGGDDHG